MCRHYRGSLIIILLVALLSGSTRLSGQACAEDYFNIDFTTQTVQEPSGAIYTGNDGILLTGTVLRYNSLLKEGWLTIFSARGTQLWSRRYYSGRYNYVVFNDVKEATDGGFLISGNIGDVDTTTWPVTHLTQYALLLKVDKYGNFTWSRTLGKVYEPEAFSNISSITATDNNECIVSMDYYTYRSYALVMRLAEDGTVKWTTSLQTSFQYPYLSGGTVKQLANGNAALVNYVSVFDDVYQKQRQGYYLTVFDGLNGNKKWERYFIDNDTLAATSRAFGNVANIMSLPDGGISFVTSFAVDKVANFRDTRQVLDFRTDSTGDHLKVMAYENGGNALYTSSVAEAGGGERVLLMDNSDTPFLMQVQVDGQIKWQSSFGAIGRSQETRNVLSTPYGNYFFSFTHNGGSKFLKLVKTDDIGGNECIAAPASLTMREVTFLWTYEFPKITYEHPGVVWNEFSSLTTTGYSMSGITKCFKSCCTDITDTADKVSLCNVPVYTLPNNEVVKNSGTYTITYTTDKGCDSIVYYQVDLSNTPVISLGPDRCMGEKDTIMLKTQTGFDTYTWNGQALTDPLFTVRGEGAYNVAVSNNCGIASDTIMVYKQCQFDILMPNAFTPNRDNVNDIFRVPPQVSNNLVSFTVFDRWGKIVFRTSNIAEGWNGMVREYPAPPGVYVYHIVMRSIDGRRTVAKKGYVLLVR